MLHGLLMTIKQILALTISLFILLVIVGIIYQYTEKKEKKEKEQASEEAGDESSEVEEENESRPMYRSRRNLSRKKLMNMIAREMGLHVYSLGDNSCNFDQYYDSTKTLVARFYENAYAAGEELKNKFLILHSRVYGIKPIDNDVILLAGEESAVDSIRIYVNEACYDIVKAVKCDDKVIVAGRIEIEKDCVDKPVIKNAYILAINDCLTETAKKYLDKDTRFCIEPKEV